MSRPRHLALLACAAGLLGSTAAAAGPPPPGRQACFLRSDVDSFSAPNDRMVYLRTSSRETFRLDLMGECPGLGFRQSFGLEDRPASPWICSPLEATVVFRDTGIAQRCPVTAIHKLTPDELAALPKRDRP